ncbi:hypothetical protein Golomagni_05850 [Golovinomyces magnicellulatus]|nr:hypothetical protein Golomagni_05850 [Golovinomyces magnicellulatus]
MAPTVATTAGIVTDAKSGQREIPESTRADGSTRKAIKVRPGFRPAEDVELYRARNAQGLRTRGQRTTIPGAAPREDKPAAERPTVERPARVQPVVERTAVESPTSQRPTTSTSSSNSRSARSMDWRRRDTPPEEKSRINDIRKPQKDIAKEEPKAEEPVDPEAEKQKKARNLKKKLKQAQELKSKKDEGQGLLPEQIAKVIKINELVRELEALGIDSEEEPKKED